MDQISDFGSDIRFCEFLKGFQFWMDKLYWDENIESLRDYLPYIRNYQFLDFKFLMNNQYQDECMGNLCDYLRISFWSFAKEFKF